MPSDASVFLVLLVCPILLIALAWEISSRRASPTVRGTQDRPAPHPARVTLTRTLPALLCAFLCGVGALWLLPWATILPSIQDPGLAPGILFITLLSIGVLYALKGREVGK